MMASNMQNTNQMVVVWEWMNEFGHWRPYDPHVSDFLEKNSNVSTLGQTSFNLGHADQSLAMYSADFTTMCQVRFGTGTARPIRRTLYPLTSPPGKGIVWQWEGDLPGQWHNYDLQVSIVVEDYFSQNSNSLGQLDLSKSPVKLPYVLDLHNMTQTRIETGRVRQLRRDFLNSPYTISSQNSGCNVTPASNHVRLGTKRRANGSCSFINNQKRGRSNVLPSQASNMQSGQVPGFATSSSVLSQGGGLHTSNTQMAHGPVTRKKLNMMSASQVSQCNQQIHPFVYPKLQSQPPSQGSSIHQPHQQQQITSNSVPLTQQGISQFGQSSGSFLHNVNMTSHSSLQPGAMQFPNQFGSVQQGSHMLQNSGQQPNGVINFHGNNTGISVPGALLGRSKNASRISPVVTSATNLLMSPAVPMLLSNSSSSGGMTQFNLPLEDRIPNNAPKAKKHASNKASNCDIFDKYTTVVDKPAEDEDCCICCEKLNQASGYGEDKQDSHIVFKLEKCNHMFHKLCIQAMYDSGSKNGCLQCPTCKTIYGEKNGNCPSGVMEYHRLSQSLPSYEDCHTIQILYHISPGIQGPEHPHPGKRYSCRGFPRVCYLPDNEKGRKVLKLLTVAWKRRLTFTIGMSTTTGESDTVTWNEIHHKTEFGTNHSGHGYPDANYLENVLMELAVHGVTECDL